MSGCICTTTSPGMASWKRYFLSSSNAWLPQVRPPLNNAQRVPSGPTATDATSPSTLCTNQRCCSSDCPQREVDYYDNALGACQMCCLCFCLMGWCASGSLRATEQPGRAALPALCCRRVLRRAVSHYAASSNNTCLSPCTCTACIARAGLTVL